VGDFVDALVGDFVCVTWVGDFVGVASVGEAVGSSVREDVGIYVKANVGRMCDPVRRSVGSLEGRSVRLSVGE
jgi:hypothetical protein